MYQTNDVKAVKEESRATKAILEVGGKIDELFRNIETLENRLGPIMKIVVKNLEKPSGAIPTMSSPFVGSIGLISDRITKASILINEIIDRLEI